MAESPKQMRFRSGSALELKRIDDLPLSQRSAFAELQRDPDFYGLLVSPTTTAKAIDRATAELFLRLTVPATLRLDDDLIDLVLDGILEVECDGVFVFGADAFASLIEAKPARIGTLAGDALRHAEELETAEVAALTNALYAYNRIPRTRAWAARFPAREQVLAHIGADEMPLRAVLERHWMRSQEGWIAWQSRAARPRAHDAVTWKLYVSPRPEHIRDAFHALVRVLSNVEGASMKIGPDAGGLLRPDKLMAYFAAKEELDDAASALASELRGCPAHGVPFTAPYDDDALLSWGTDPPDSDRALSWLDRESWRLWIAKSLAGAMSIAKQATKPAITPSQFAIERVRRLGVDIETWSA